MVEPAVRGASGGAGAEAILWHALLPRSFGHVSFPGRLAWRCRRPASALDPGPLPVHLEFLVEEVAPRGVLGAGPVRVGWSPGTIGNW